jgi:hypothetical protein
MSSAAAFMGRRISSPFRGIRTREFAHAMMFPDTSLAALTILFAIPRARGGAERRAESGPSFGPRRRSISF